MFLISLTISSEELLVYYAVFKIYYCVIFVFVYVKYASKSKQSNYLKPVLNVSRNLEINIIIKL